MQLFIGIMLKTEIFDILPHHGKIVVGEVAVWEIVVGEFSNWGNRCWGRCLGEVRTWEVVLRI